MDKNEDSGSPGWGASLFMQTEDAARALLAAASAATVRSPRPSVVFSSTDDNGDSQIQKLQRRVARMLKGLSATPEVKGSYNPEILTSQKRQWARFQLQSSVLFVYPPEKQLPLKYKDLLSFCFPGGLEVYRRCPRVAREPSPTGCPQVVLARTPSPPVGRPRAIFLPRGEKDRGDVHAVERTPSMSELNEIVLGQEQLKQSNQSFVFRLKTARYRVVPSKLVSRVLLFSGSLAQSIAYGRFFTGGLPSARAGQKV
ncbi:hypothetical protein GW17_00024117 [Ensete ventricosum]|nr:hypothetical protein GW17_00024117 [Ensete ventricosum]